MVQVISKNKLLLITLIILFAFLSNLYFLSGVNGHRNHLATDLLSQVIDDLSNQAITTKDHRSDYSLSYRPFKLNFSSFRLFTFDCETVRLFTPQVSGALTIIGLFFLIYYQLSRTSSEKSASCDVVI